ncbi:MAG: hypothetical protein FE78DRAFT_159727 [Acidomyces sp. 'richmondensis']|nr:MAG: hypothetical protein FE78DRAFT_159727 [Acidomyces sp. 'richmondensis']
MMEPILNEERGVRLAVEGCGHGTLNAIYASVEEACRRKGWLGVDLLIIGGDFQSVRNAYDLNCVSMPAKYRSMGDFHEYYSGQRNAPYLTIFVGGNHEASNSLFELYYGGWVAPKIYYLGAANVVRLGPLRIAGMSGIWKGYNYRKPHHERLPYNETDIKSIYHIRELDVRKLLQIRTQVDIGLSHDWPKGIEWKGAWKQLFRHKKHLEDDARNGQLGNVAAAQVMDRLRPRYWFSAHLHCKYAAIPVPMEHPPDIINLKTKFLALDKCMPGKQFLQLISDPIEKDVERDRPLKLEYDREWLAIVRAFALAEPLIVGDPQARVPPPKCEAEYRQLIEEQQKWIEEHVADTTLHVPEVFSITAPVYDGGNWNLPQYSIIEEQPNPQTAHFCEMLEIPNPFEISKEAKAARMAAGTRPDPDAERYVFKRDRGGPGRGRGHGRARGVNKGRYRGR